MPHRFRMAIPVFTLALAISAAFQANAQGAVKQVLGTPTRTLSPAVRIGDLIFVSGHIGGGDSTIQGQTTNALTTIKNILEAAGSAMTSVVKCTVFLIDVKDFAGMNQSYAAIFPKDPPARSTLVVAALVVPTGKVEIECIASAAK